MTAVLLTPSRNADSAFTAGRESQECTTRLGLALDTGPPAQPSAPRGLGRIRGPGGRSLQEPGREAGVEAAVGEAVRRLSQVAGEYCPLTVTCGFEAVCYVALL